MKRSQAAKPVKRLKKKRNRGIVKVKEEDRHPQMTTEYKFLLVIHQTEILITAKKLNH